MTPTFYHTSLETARQRIAPATKHMRLRLDKNEQTADVATALKQEALNALLESDWNRYPQADLDELHGLIAGYCGLRAEQVVAGPGSASIITVLLNYFGINGKRIIINQPSYSLFEYHCRTYNIAYEPWLLNDDLQFDLATMPDPDANSVVIITSPNNPAGNAIRPAQLQHLLQLYPRTLFLLDAVYSEYGEHDFTPLVNDYNNLMVLRSFSKAFPAAGIRLGYLCTNAAQAAMISKLMLPFAINAFTLGFAKTVLFNPSFIRQSLQTVKDICAERNRLFQLLCDCFEPHFLKPYASQGNFLLVRLGDAVSFRQVIEGLQRHGISVLDVSSQSLLQNCFRVTVGRHEENENFFHALFQVVLGIRGMHHVQ